MPTASSSASSVWTLIEAISGATRRDLFGDATYLENPELLDALVVEKLRLIEQELKAEGWGWIEISQERDWTVISGCGRIYPKPAGAPQELLDEVERLHAELGAIAEEADAGEEDPECLEEKQEAAEARLAEIEEKLKSSAVFDPEQMKTAGCYVTIDHNGELTIEKGLVRRQDMKRVAGPDAAKERKPKGMPETLRRALESYRLQVAQVAIATHPTIAFDLLAFHVACGVFGHLSPHDGPDVHFRQSYASPAVEGKTVAAERLEALGKDFPVGIFEEENEASGFEAFCNLTGAVKLDILAYCVALTLKPKLAPADAGEATAYDIALSLSGASVADHWRPTRDNYLSRITRDQLVAIGREVLGEQWAQFGRKDKKGELVDQLDRAFSTPEQAGRMPEQVSKLKSWLPAGMAFGSIAAPSIGAQAA